MRKYLFALLLVLAPTFVLAAAGGYPLDRAPSRASDMAALQNGAKLFVNYCLNCHSASLMRYNRLKDIGLTDAQIKANLLFSADKVGETMKVAMTVADSKQWFGAPPPDLSVITRARSSSAGSGADYVYTYLRSYYRDASRPTGWNNLVLQNSAMPHVLWERQGPRELLTTLVHEQESESKGKTWETVTTSYDRNGIATVKKELLSGHAGHASFQAQFTNLDKTADVQYERDVADLVGFLTYVSDPSAMTRQRLGVWVLLFLGVFSVVAWWLNSVYWRDVK